MAKSKSIRTRKSVKPSRPEPTPKPDLAEILGRFTDALSMFHCVARALAERQDPHDADSDPVKLGDELVTLNQAIAVLTAAINALDGVTA